MQKEDKRKSGDENSMMARKIAVRSLGGERKIEIGHRLWPRSDDDGGGKKFQEK